jgi:outer membrane murein-binding lipoprotein Lpp
MWKIKATAYAKRNQVLTAELEEAEDDIKLLREELTAAEEDRREMNAHIDKVCRV